jgi:ABC-2 type transport system permease protein
VRGVFLQGAGIETLWPQVIAMTVFGIVVLTLSVQRFHKHLE